MVRPLLLALLVVAPLGAAAQDPVIRWGRLSDAEKALDRVDDPDAHAVVLGDVGLAELDLQMGPGVGYRLRRHKRVKVLDEAGYDQGEFAFRYGSGDRFRRVKGQTFVPEGDGGYRRVELAGADVFDEEVAPGLREVRFSMPALAPGAIFEIEYVYETPSVTVLPDWYFQADAPTLASEYRLKLPVYFEYMTITQGARAEQQETAQVRGFDYDAKEFRWIARDLPAIRDEPYTTTEADHLERIGFQLRRVQRRDGLIDEVLTSWEDVAEVLGDHEAFGRRTTNSRAVRALVEQATAGVDADDAAARARALYDLVRTGFVWDGDRAVFGDRDPDAVIESRTGDAGELAHLLLALYDAAGIEAHPVLLSSRPNGRPYQSYPFVDQFDTLLVAPVIPGAGLTLLDPTSPHRPYGEIAVRALNGDAWLVDPARPRWVRIPTARGTATTTTLRGTLSAEGALAADLTVQLAGYDAFDARERLAAPDGTPGEAVSEAADAADDTRIEVVEVTGLDDVDGDIQVAATLTATAAEAIGDEMYLTPFVAMRLDENPFVRDTRAFPVDYPHPFTRTYVAEIEVPAGWEPVDLPPALSLAIPSRRVRYQRFVADDGGRLRVRAVLTVTGGQVAATEYPELRALYDEVVAAEAEALVLARVAAPGAGVEAGEPGAGGR